MKIFSKGWSFNKDGPGNRRIYYLKGCNLRCKWCASPESINFTDELLFYPERAAGEKLDFLCPAGAITDNKLDRSKCGNCREYQCRRFRHKAMEWAGTEISGNEILQEVLDAKDNWSSFAGVTFGGGEPALQAKELKEVLRLLREHKIATAIESNGIPEGFVEIVHETDLVITDLKSGTPETFRELTGGILATVVNHHQYAARHAKELLIRIPVITTLNDSEKELTAMSEILRELNLIRQRATGRQLQVELLKLHHFGQSKYAALNRDYPAAGLPPVPPEKIRFMENLLANAGIIVVKS